jgi:hypothetical protein
VRDLCSVNSYGRPLTLNVERGIWNRLVNGFTMSDDEILAAFARANNTDVANIQQRVMDGVMHTLRQPPGMFRVNTTQLINDGPFHTTSKEGSWLKSLGVVQCGTERPWLPIAVSVGYTRMDSHALFLLINRGTGHAYLFESNGFDPDNEGAFRVTHALIALSAIYEHLISSGNLTLSEWRTTSFVTDMMSGDSIRGQGPQGLQGDKTTLLGHEGGTCAAWAYLFYHLFILHPELEQDALLQRMLAPEQGPYHGHIIGRYSMFIAERITAKLTIRNVKY